MACVTPEGKPTESEENFNALKSGAASPEEIAKPVVYLYSVRSGLLETWFPI